MKHLKLTFLLAILMSLVSIPATAYDIAVQNSQGVLIYYSWTNGRTELSVTSKLNYYSGNVVIPESVTYYDVTYPVTGIGARAFLSCSGLTSVTIPNSVTSIGVAAFFECTGLTSITIPNSVTSIGGSAFAECTGLTSITIPNSVTSIGTEEPFYGCSGLTSIDVEDGNTVYDSRQDCNAIIETSSNTLLCGCKNTVIPNSVTSIGGYAFQGCTGLTSITIPNSVTSIGKEAFKGCNNLTSITIPNNVTSIGNYAFSRCSGLTSITIPNSVTSIGTEAFYGCSGLTSIDVEDGNTVYDSRQDCNAIIETSSNTLLCGCKNTFIPNSVTSIGNLAFYDCTGLTSINIPNSVTSIGYQAFYGCSGLTSIWIPNSVTSIEGSTFQNCTGLTSVEIPNSVTSIGGHAFNGCNSLTSITIPNGVTSIEGSTFENCTGLTSITIPNSVTSIGNYAFSGCNSLTKVIVPDIAAWCGISFSYGNNPLDYAHHLYSDENTEITNLVIPDGVTSIGEWAFLRCTGLTSVTIPNSVTSIEQSAFSGCSGLTSVVSEIETPFAFGSNAFNYISANCVLTVPYGKTDAYIAAGWTTSVFNGGIVETPLITFADANVKALCIANWDTDSDGELSSEEAAAVTNLGTVFQGNTTITSFDELQYFTGLSDINVEAFAGCTGLTSVVIPVDVIRSSAFYNCSSLASIQFTNSMTYIGSQAFYNTAWLNSQPDGLLYVDKVLYKYKGTMPANTDIVLDEETLCIGGSAFADCDNLASVTIPNSVTSIGTEAFKGCNNLTSVVSEIETPFAFETDAFDDISDNCVLTVPNGKRDAYIAQGWTTSVFKGGVVDAASVEITMETGSGVPRTMIGYSSKYSLDFTSVTEVKAYIAVGYTDKGDVILAHVYVVPAYTGMVLKTDNPGVVINVPKTTDDVYYANLLQPAVDNVTIYPTETIDGINYTNLMVGPLDKGGMGFVDLETVKAYSKKSYLRVPTSFYQGVSAARQGGLGIVFEDSESTDIDSIRYNSDTTDDAYYDLQGRKVTPTKKGLYIRNGKKVFIK